MPKTARLGPVGVLVHAQANHGCATRRGDAFDPLATLHPSKMIGPTLAAGMEQRNKLPVQWIRAFGPVALERIAAPTGKGEV
jgi:hypothetical protein